MEVSTHALTDKFLRTCCRKITARDMSKFFSSIGVRVNLAECRAFLESNPLIFALEDDTYITRAAAFTGELFSIKPTAAEYDQKMFVPGTRCSPFIDADMITSSLTFVFEKTGQILPSKVGKFDSDLAIDMFILCGEEYAPQYIAADPANCEEDFAFREYELLNDVNLTGIDISVLIDSYGFRKGDRLLCYVEDWDRGIIRIDTVLDGHNTFNLGLDGSLRIEWYKRLEEGLLSSFKRLGPCGSMEEQVANVFFENLKDLSIPQCGSLEEYINTYAKKVGICEFGVESRFWFKDQIVPAVGEWNAQDLEDFGFKRPQPKNQDILLSFPIEVIDQFIFDSYYKREKDFTNVLERMYPDDYVFHKDEKTVVLLTLKQRDEVLSKKYNWFADQENGVLRSEALSLFTDINVLMYKVDSTVRDIKSFPQSELITLTQLYGHVVNILQALVPSGNSRQDTSVLFTSVEGMKWNLDDIRDIIEYAVRAQRKKGLSVVKQ